jgi:hypothetical protein
MAQGWGEPAVFLLRRCFRLARWLDTAIHPLRVILAHSWLPKIAAKGSAQRYDGVT